MISLQETRKMKPKKAAGEHENRLRAVAVIAVVLALLITGIVIATGSSKSRKVQITAQDAQPATEQPAATGAEENTIETVQVPPLSVYRRRNIFKPLVNMEPGAELGTAPGTVTAGAGGTTPGVITLPPELDTTGSEAGTVISTAVTLEGVVEQGDRLFARIRVGDTLYEKVGVGEVFGSYYKLLSLYRDRSEEHTSELQSL